MTIKSIQTLIKVGSSTGVTIPAKDLKYAGLKAGQDVLIRVDAAPLPQEHSVKVAAITRKLITRHKKALKNLSKR